MKYMVVRSVVIIGCLFALTACVERKRGLTRYSEQEISGDVASRVDRVSSAIAKRRALPTPILDAHFVEERMGDGELGPSDFRDFYHIEVAPQDVGQWTQILTPITDTSGDNAPKPRYEKPKSYRDWWISPHDFGSLEFYEQDTLGGRDQGWIGVSRQKGQIYIFAYTM